MKRRNFLVLSAIALGSFGASCGHHASAAASDWRRVAAGRRASLVVRTEGSTGIHTSESTNAAKEGETIHRVVRGDDGKALFAYDVILSPTDDKREYTVQLLPAAFGVPTLKAKREVAARIDEDLVRVELMEQPETHEKIVDVYRLTGYKVEQKLSLMELHNRLFRWVHSL